VGELLQRYMIVDWREKMCGKSKRGGKYRLRVIAGYLTGSLHPASKQKTGRDDYIYMVVKKASIKKRLKKHLPTNEF